MASNNDVTLSGRITELENKLAATLDRVAKAEATVEQLNKSIAAGNRMTNWQFIGFVVVMAGTLFGTMYWSTGVLERNMNARFEEMNRRFDDTNKKMDQRFEDMNRRFEDLRQVVLSQQKR
jgi:thiosulfate reductase cytochrome b subunit